VHNAQDNQVKPLLLRLAQFSNLLLVIDATIESGGVCTRLPRQSIFGQPPFRAAKAILTELEKVDKRSTLVFCRIGKRHRLCLCQNDKFPSEAWEKRRAAEAALRVGRGGPAESGFDVDVSPEVSGAF
jgi:hypothetical protein